MKKFIILILTATVLIFLHGCSTTPPWFEIGETPVASLVKDLRGKTPETARAHFRKWTETLPGSGLPLELDGDLIFLFQLPPGAGVKNLSLATSLDQFEVPHPLVNPSGTGLWIGRIPKPVEPFSYHFLLEEPDGKTRVLADPHNPWLLPLTLPSSRWFPDSQPRGTIHEVVEIPVPAPLQSRPVWIYLPPGYRQDTDRRYPVYYALEGQWAWDHPTIRNGGYKLDTTLDRLISQKKMEPVILVAVPFVQASKGGEYLGWGAYYGQTTTPAEEAKKTRFLAQSEAFRKLMIQTVKPWVDTHYRTRPEPEHTAVGAGSFGGGAALTLALLHPETFGKAASLATGQYRPGDPQWKDNPFRLFDRLAEETRSALAAGRPGLGNVKLWIDSGTEDIDAKFIVEIRELARQLEEAGLGREKNLLYREFPGTGHHEGWWAKRMDQVFMALFPPRTTL